MFESGVDKPRTEKQEFIELVSEISMLFLKKIDLAKQIPIAWKQPPVQSLCLFGQQNMFNYSHRCTNLGLEHSYDTRIKYINIA